MKAGTLNKSCTARWCPACNCWHGHLFNCEHYPNELRTQLNREGEQFLANLTDPDWRAKQQAKGVPEEVLDIFVDIAKENLDTPNQ